MEFVLLYLTFLLSFVNYSRAGDGVGNFIIKAMKTTTPLIRPPRNGFYLNVHEQENIAAGEELAIKMGLESQISRLWDDVHKWENEVHVDGKQLKRDISVARAINTANNIIGDFDKDHPSVDQQAIVDDIFKEYMNSEVRQAGQEEKAAGVKSGLRPDRPDFSPNEKPLKKESPEIECMREGSLIVEQKLKKGPCGKTKVLMDRQAGK